MTPGKTKVKVTRRSGKHSRVDRHHLVRCAAAYVNSAQIGIRREPTPPRLFYTKMEEGCFRETMVGTLTSSMPKRDLKGRVWLVPLSLPTQWIDRDPGGNEEILTASGFIIDRGDTKPIPFAHGTQPEGPNVVGASAVSGATRTEAPSHLLYSGIQKIQPNY